MIDEEVETGVQVTEIGAIQTSLTNDEEDDKKIDEMEQEKPKKTIVIKEGLATITEIRDIETEISCTFPDYVRQDIPVTNHEVANALSTWEKITARNVLEEFGYGNLKMEHFKSKENETWAIIIENTLEEVDNDEYGLYSLHVDMQYVQRIVKSQLLPMINLLSLQKTKPNMYIWNFPLKR